MACHHYLISVSPQFLCKLDADLMAQLGSHLARLEALVSVVSKNRTAISEVLAHLHHGFVWVARTVDRAYKVNLFILDPFGFLAVFDIVKFSCKVVVLGLFGIASVLDHAFYRILDCPNLRCCQAQTASLSSYHVRVSDWAGFYQGQDTEYDTVFSTPVYKFPPLNSMPDYPVGTIQVEHHLIYGVSNEVPDNDLSSTLTITFTAN